MIKTNLQICRSEFFTSNYGFQMCSHVCVCFELAVETRITAEVKFSPSFLYLRFTWEPAVESLDINWCGVLRCLGNYRDMCCQGLGKLVWPQRGWSFQLCYLCKVGKAPQRTQELAFIQSTGLRVCHLRVACFRDEWDCLFLSITVFTRENQCTVVLKKKGTKLGVEKQMP